MNHSVAMTADLAMVRRVRAQRFYRLAALWLGFAVLLVCCGLFVGVEFGVLAQLPARFVAVFGEMLPEGLLTHPITAFAEWFHDTPTLVRALTETLLIALLGTIGGVALGLWLALASAQSTALYRVTAFLARRVAEALRIVPELLFALIFVGAFGIGPTAGVLAVALHSAGSFAKMLTERIENIDLSAAHALQAVGASRMGRIRFGVWPAILPDVINLSLLRLEINVRASSAVGIVGAGGLGQELKIALDQFYPLDAGAILLLMAVSVMVFSALSQYAQGYVAAWASAERNGLALSAQVLARGRQKRLLYTLGGAVLTLGLIMGSARLLNITASSLWQGSGRAAQTFSLMWPPQWDMPAQVYITALGQTLTAVILGAFVAALIALPIALVASTLNTYTRWFLRRCLDVLRSVDMLVWALLFVGMVGPGAFAGALAIAAAEVGILSRLFTDSALAVSDQQKEGLRSTGASEGQVVRYLLLPQAMPDWIANFLYQIETNIRSAAVLGIAGAGGIGFYLAESIRLNRFGQTLGILLLLACLVVMVDRASIILRHRVRNGYGRTPHLPSNKPI